MSVWAVSSLVVAAWAGSAGAAPVIAPSTVTAAAAPVAASTAPPTAEDAELRGMIPDAAVANPDAWAAQAYPAPAATAPTGVAPGGVRLPPAFTPSGVAAVPVLSPDSPLASNAGFEVAWPDEQLSLPALATIAPDPAATAALAAASADASQAAGGALERQNMQVALPDVAHDTTIAGGRMVLAWPIAASSFPDRGAFETRFRSLSALQGASAKDPDALAQIAVRAASDRALLQRLLRVYGYYDGEVLQTLAAPEPGEANAQAGVSVRFDILPAERYRLGTIALGQLSATGSDYPALRKAFAVQEGDVLQSDTITAEVTHLATALGETGYPFATLGKPVLTVDHTRHAGDLDLPVTPGGKYRFGTMSSNQPRYLSANHLGDIARFRPGQLYKRSEVDDLRRAVLATGLVSSVEVTPREATPPQGDTPGIIDMDVAMARGPRHTISGELGYDTAEGARLAASWEDRNLFPPEGSLKLRGVVGTDEQLAGVTFRRSNFLGRDRVLTVDLYADNANLTAYAARKVSFSTTYERLTTLVFQKPWSWSMGVEVQASEEREGVPNGITTDRTFYLTTALPLRAAFDGSDNLLDPHHGWRAALRVSPEHSWVHDIGHSYARIQADGSLYLPVKKTVVLATRVRLGSLVGTGIDNVAPSRRFYAGGGGSIRGFGYELVGPRNALGEPKGGRSLYEFSIEARVKTGWFGGALQVVPFLDTGGAETGVLPRFNDIRYGAGLGFRYVSSFGPVRVDIGTPLNPRAGDSRIGVYVALGQAF